MSALLESVADSGSIALAQAPALGGGQAAGQVLARIPPDGVRADLPVRIDQGGQIILTQVPNVGALRKMVIDSDLIISAPGMGILVVDNFVRAAHAAQHQGRRTASGPIARLLVENNVNVTVT